MAWTVKITMETLGDGGVRKSGVILDWDDMSRDEANALNIDVTRAVTTVIDGYRLAAAQAEPARPGAK